MFPHWMLPGCNSTYNLAFIPIRVPIPNCRHPDRSGAAAEWRDPQLTLVVGPL
jgi:hypothetical protein